MTPAGPMRTLLPSRLFQTSNVVYNIATKAAAANGVRCGSGVCLRNRRCFAQVNDIDKSNRNVRFTTATPYHAPQGAQGDHAPPDERTLQLGKTVRILHERLPTLLLSPLPPEILSPQISLHLFPSTHPHLPTVSGRLAYIAALWTAPMAWGRVPLVGNVKLTILSERMLRNDGSANRVAGNDAKLIVKWKTCGKTRHRDGTGGIYRGMGIAGKDPVDRIKDFVAGTANKTAAAATSTPEQEEFCGLFVFEFDENGRIVKHVIEHTEEGGHSDHMTRVVSVTDWLLGRFHGRDKEQLPELACCKERQDDERMRIADRRQRFE